MEIREIILLSALGAICAFFLFGAIRSSWVARQRGKFIDACQEYYSVEGYEEAERLADQSRVSSIYDLLVSYEEMMWSFSWNLRDFARDQRAYDEIMLPEPDFS